MNHHVFPHHPLMILSKGKELDYVEINRGSAIKGAKRRKLVLAKWVHCPDKLQANSRKRLDWTAGLFYHPDRFLVK